MGTYKGCTENMVELIYCESKLLKKNAKIKQNGSFMEAYVNESFELGNIRDETKIICMILYEK